MTKLWMVDCINCGRQVEISGPEDICYWCHMSASKKEVIMVQKEGTVEERVVPPKPKNRNKHKKYWEQNKEAMIADYRSMRVSSFFIKWGICSATWQKLKKGWGIPNKQRGIGTQAPVKLLVKGETEGLTEHEHYLILIGYQMAARDFLKADKS